MRYCILTTIIPRKKTALLTVFTKSHITRYSLVSISENLKNTLYAAIFTHLSKAFETLNLNLLVKLRAHGFRKDALNYMKNYLNNRLEWVRVDNSLSSN